MARIGQLDRRVTIQRPVVVTSAAGASTVSFVDVAGAPTVWAKIESLPGGTEMDEAGRLQPRAFWRVTIRRRGGIERGFRFVYGDRALHIRDIGDDSSRSAMLECVCVEYPP